MTPEENRIRVIALFEEVVNVLGQLGWGVAPEGQQVPAPG